MNKSVLIRLILSRIYQSEIRHYLLEEINLVCYILSVMYKKLEHYRFNALNRNT